MDWGRIAGVVADAAPLLGGLLGGPAGAAAGGIVAAALGVEAEPDAVARAIQADPEAALRLREIETAHRARLTALAVDAEAHRLTAETARLREVNETARREVASGDAYVRRMRPTAGYVVILTLGVEVLAACAVMLWRPEHAAAVAALIGALVTPQSIALSVLGVYVWRRSAEKLADAGALPAPGRGLIGAVAERIRGHGGPAS